MFAARQSGCGQGERSARRGWSTPRRTFSMATRPGPDQSNPRRGRTPTRYGSPSGEPRHGSAPVAALHERSRSILRPRPKIGGADRIEPDAAGEGAVERRRARRETTATASGPSPIEGGGGPGSRVRGLAHPRPIATRRARPRRRGRRASRGRPASRAPMKEARRPAVAVGTAKDRARRASATRPLAVRRVEPMRAEDRPAARRAPTSTPPDPPTRSRASITATRRPAPGRRRADRDTGGAGADDGDVGHRAGARRQRARRPAGARPPGATCVFETA